MKHLVGLFRPYPGNFIQHVKKSENFAHGLATLWVTPEGILGSFVVVSHLTEILIGGTFELLSQQIHKDSIRASTTT
jgi:hypothetical protein